MNKYIRLCKKVNQKGILIPSDSLWDNVTHNEESYHGVYYYNEEHRKQFYEQVINEKTKELDNRGCKGIKDVITDKLWFDFDNKENPELAKNDTIVVLDKLVKLGIKEEDIEIYFSGNKGFALLLTTNKEFNPSQVYDICVNKLGTNEDGSILKTLDSTLYDPPQIFRVPGSRHPETNLFKIPLTSKQLRTLSVESIKKLASNLNNIKDEFNWEVVNFPDIKVESPKKINDIKSTYELDLSLKPSQWKNCKWSILQGNFKSGERHSALMVLAATCKAMGYDMHTTYYMCKSAVKKQASHSGTDEFPKDELFKNIIEDSVFKEGWEGGQFTCKKDGWLKNYCKSLGNKACKHDEIDRETPVKLYEVKDGFLDFVKNIEQNTIKTGIRQLDETMPLTIGLHCGIIGAPGSGKSSLALDILENTSRQGIPTICASLDMHRNRFFEKTIYRVSNLSREQVYKKIKNNDYKDLMDKVQDAFKNVWFYDKSCPTVEDLKTYLLKVQELEGRKVKLVLIDYFERINSDRSEDTAASKDIAGQLQDLVNDFNICLITMVQPNKFSISGGPDQPIKNYSAIKGSSFLSQSFRSIISIWRPFYTPETKELDNYLQMAILKNDLGELDLFNFGWHGRTGKIRELSEEEEETFKQLLKEKEENKSNVKNDGWE